MKDKKPIKINKVSVKPKVTKRTRLEHVNRFVMADNDVTIINTNVPR